MFFIENFEYKCVNKWKFKETSEGNYIFFYTIIVAFILFEPILNLRVIYKNYKQ